MAFAAPRGAAPHRSPFRMSSPLRSRGAVPTVKQPQPPPQLEHNTGIFGHVWQHPYVDILRQCGALQRSADEPLPDGKYCELRGDVTRPVDPLLQQTVLLVRGVVPAANCVCIPPAASGTRLGLRGRCLYLVLRCGPDQRFAAHVDVSVAPDSRSAVRYSLVGGATGSPSAQGRVVQLPAGRWVRPDRWAVVCLDLRALVAAFFPGTAFVRLDALQFCPSLTVRAAFSSDEEYCAETLPRPLGLPRSPPEFVWVRSGDEAGTGPVPSQEDCQPQATAPVSAAVPASASASVSAPALAPAPLRPMTAVPGTLTLGRVLGSSPAAAGAAWLDGTGDELVYACGEFVAVGAGPAGGGDRYVPAAAGAEDLEAGPSDVQILCPDGQGTLLATSQGSDVRVWCIDRSVAPVSLRHLSRLAEHAGGGVRATAFSPDGRCLAAAGLDARGRLLLVVWDLTGLLASLGDGDDQLLDPTDRLVRDRLAAPRVIARQLVPDGADAVASLAWSPTDPQSLMSCGRESAKFWLCRGGHLPHSSVALGEHGRGALLSACAYHPSRPVAFCASSRGRVIGVSTETRQLTVVYELYRCPLTALCIRGNLCATGTSLGDVAVWPLDFAAPVLHDRLEEVGGEVRRVDLHASGDRVLASGADGSVSVAGLLGQGWETVSVGRARAPLRALAVFSGVAACSANDGTIRVWDLESGRMVTEIATGPDGCATALAFHPRPPRGLGPVLAVGFDRGTVCLVDLSSGQGQRLAERHLHVGPVVDLQFSGCGRRLVSSGDDGSVCLYRAKTLQPLHLLGALEAPAKAAPQGACMARRGHLLAVPGAQPNQLAVYDWTSMTAAGRVTAPPGLPVPFSRVAFCASGSEVVALLGGGLVTARLPMLRKGDDAAAADRDGPESEGGQVWRLLDVAAIPATAFALESRGRLAVAAGSDSAAVTVWDTQVGRVVGTWQQRRPRPRQHPEAIVAACFDDHVRGRAARVVVAAGAALYVLVVPDSQRDERLGGPEDGGEEESTSDFEEDENEEQEEEDMDDGRGHTHAGHERSGPAAERVLLPVADQVSLPPLPPRLRGSSETIVGVAGAVGGAVDWSPRSGLVASGCGNVIVVRQARRAPDHLCGHAGPVAAVAVSADGAVAVSGSAASSSVEPPLCVWDLGQRPVPPPRQLQFDAAGLPGHPAGVLSVGIAPERGPNGQTVLFSLGRPDQAGDAWLCVWSTGDLRPRAAFRLAGGAHAAAVCLSAAGDLPAGHDTFARAVPGKSRRLKVALALRSAAGLVTVTFSADVYGDETRGPVHDDDNDGSGGGSSASSSGGGGTMRTLAVPNSFGDEFLCCASGFAAGRPLVAAGSRAGFIGVVDSDTGETLCRLRDAGARLGQAVPIRSVALLEDGRVAAGTEDGAVAAYVIGAADAAAPIWRVDLVPQGKGPRAVTTLSAYGLSGQSRLLAGSPPGGTWLLQEDRPPLALERGFAARGAVQWLSWWTAPGGTRLLLVAGPAGASVWEAGDRNCELRLLWTLGGDVQGVRHAALRSDGRWAVIRIRDGVGVGGDPRAFPPSVLVLRADSPSVPSHTPLHQWRSVVASFGRPVATAFSEYGLAAGGPSPPGLLMLCGTDRGAVLAVEADSGRVLRVVLPPPDVDGPVVPEQARESRAKAANDGPVAHVECACDQDGNESWLVLSARGLVTLFRFGSLHWTADVCALGVFDAGAAASAPPLARLCGPDLVVACRGAELFLFGASEPEARPSAHLALPDSVTALATGHALVDVDGDECVRPVVAGGTLRGQLFWWLPTEQRHMLVGVSHAGPVRSAALLAVGSGSRHAERALLASGSDEGEILVTSLELR